MPYYWIPLCQAVISERKVKKQKRETHQDRICNLHKQQVFIRERIPERDPQPSEKHSERGKTMPLLQAGVFKHLVSQKGRLEGDALGKRMGRRMGGGAGH
jgi:hypothetical protein